MYTYTYNIGEFEQGGFYVDTGQEYNSETEIRSGWLNCGKRIFTFTLQTDYTWSFICRDLSGNFIYISEAYEYKASGTKINLSAYPNVSDIRIELHDTNGINPPATCTLVIEFAWTMGANGKPTNAFLPNISEISEKLSKPYPKNMWRISPNVNGGKPYNYFLPVPEIPPPPSKWKFTYSDNKKALFLVEKDMRFGIEISDYKFSFSVSD